VRRTRGAGPSARSAGTGTDRELEAGGRAHYEDPAYYTATYARRKADVLYYASLAEDVGGPVLEYGIGNGRIAIPIARAGVDVTGIDWSRAMLADLRQRLAREPADVRARVHAVPGDMRRVRLRRRFPLVISTFNTALHLYTRVDVERFLARVREHLLPRGKFVVDLSVPSFEDLSRDPKRAFHAPRFRHPSDGRVVKNREYFDYDRVRQILFASLEFEPVDDAAAAWTTPLAHRQFFPQEWEALLHYNGFVVDKVEGDFAGDPLERASETMVWHARMKR
jgi:SAM-dependent methyltransferase